MDPQSKRYPVGLGGSPVSRNNEAGIRMPLACYTPLFFSVKDNVQSQRGPMQVQYSKGDPGRSVNVTLRSFTWYSNPYSAYLAPDLGGPFFPNVSYHLHDVFHSHFGFLRLRRSVPATGMSLSVPLGHLNLSIISLGIWVDHLWENNPW